MESKSLLRLARDHWAIILVCVVLGVLAGQAFITVAPREYSSSADVFVTVTGGTSTGDIAQSANFSQQQARNFSAIATREVVLQPVINELSLDTTVSSLRDQVSTSVALNTSVITITAVDLSPKRSAAIANSVATYLAQVVPALTPRVDGETPIRLEVIEAAKAPAHPSSPNVPLALLMGLLGGLVLASAVVLLRGVVDARVRTKDQVIEITGVPVIGSVSFDRRLARNPIALTSDPHSVRSEQYRQLRANMRFLQPGEMHKVFVVTSSTPGEGKSTTAANVAVALAASGLRVCLVEADLRRPTLADILDLPESAGLTSALTGEIPLDDALIPWGEDGLRVLPAGPVPPNPSELLESSGTTSMFQRLREQFDILVIDSPPLNPVADAAVLARTLGGAILVVAERITRVRDLRRGIDRLAAVGVPIDGAVLSMSRSRDAARYEYEYSSDRSSARSTHRRSKSTSTTTPTAESRRVNRNDEVKDSEAIDPRSATAPNTSEVSPPSVSSDETDAVGDSASSGELIFEPVRASSRDGESEQR